MEEWILVFLLVLWALLTFAAPFVLGRYLGRTRRTLGTAVGSLLSALPSAMPFIGLLLLLALTGSLGSLWQGCQPPECGMGGIFIEMFFWTAIPCLLTGLVMGWLGFWWGCRVLERSETDYAD